MSFLDAQSTDQDNNCQAMFERETKKVVISNLHEVQFFVIIPLTEKGKIQFLILHFLRSKHWVVSIYFKDYRVYLLMCLPQAKKFLLFGDVLGV